MSRRQCAAGRESKATSPRVPQISHITKDTNLLGCYAVSIGEQLRTFRKFVVEETLDSQYLFQLLHNNKTQQQDVC